MFSWVLIVVLKNNVFNEGWWGGGGAFAQNFRNHITVYSLRIFAIIYYYFVIIFIKFHPQLTRKTRLTLLKNNGTYGQGLCGSLWITKNLGHIVV